MATTRRFSDFQQPERLRRGSVAYRFFCCLPGAKTIRRLLFIGSERLAPENQGGLEELGFTSETSMMDLFYPTRMAKIPSFKRNPGCYFDDGITKIDFVLAYERDPTGDFEGTLKSPLALLRKVREASDSNVQRRNAFILNLKSFGIKMEEDIVKTPNRNIHFIKLSAPWDVLTNYAETLQLRVPLEIQPELIRHWSNIVFSQLGIKNFLNQFVPEEPLNFYTCPFSKNKLKSFLWYDQQDTFFTTTQRIQVMNEILQTAPYGQTKKAEVGIARLLEEGAFTAAYPLHDGDYLITSGSEYYNLRYILFMFWARMGEWFKYQPIHHIRKYFGEKIAFYFAFFGFYTSWLSIFAVFGIIIFFVQTYEASQNPIIDEICSSGEKYLMCPVCKGCEIWYYSSHCMYKSATYSVDCISMIFFTLFSSFWAMTFLTNWKRNSALFAYQWSSHDVVWDEHRPRPGFAIKAPFLRMNLITSRTEPYFPQMQQNYRIALTSICIMGMVIVVFTTTIVVILYRYSLNHYNRGIFHSQVISVLGDVSAGFVQLLLIMGLGRVYKRMAVNLTEWEMHRTESEFENSLIFKIFIFQFVNYFSPLYYIAFIKDKYTHTPGQEDFLMGISVLPAFSCLGNSCFLELSIQLAIILIGKQLIYIVIEMGLPIMKRWRQESAHEDLGTSQWAKDYQLFESRGLIYEYLDLVLQFGFITMFVSTFPLAPLFALFTNWLELRLDAQKMLCQCRRTVPQQARGLEVWYSIISAITVLATITNAFVIAFTSDILPKIIYDFQQGRGPNHYLNFTLPVVTPEQYDVPVPCRHMNYFEESEERTKFYWTLTAFRFLFIIGYEHLVMSAATLVFIFVPDVPKKLELRMKRERFIARQALTEAQPTIGGKLKGKKRQQTRKKKLWSTWQKTPNRPRN